MERWTVEKLDALAKGASGDGVGFVVSRDGLSVRRDEEYAPSTYLHFRSRRQVAEHLRAQAQERA